MSNPDYFLACHRDGIRYWWSGHDAVTIHAWAMPFRSKFAAEQYAREHNLVRKGWQAVTENENMERK